MNLLIFLSLFTLTVSYIFEINSDYGIQMWEVHETINELVEINYEGPQSMTLDTNEVYIILSKCYGNVYKIFIWVGRNSSMIQRQNAAYNSVELFLLLKMHIGANRQCNRQLSISREVEGQERFLRGLFICSYYGSIPKLYKVTGNEGQYIMQVPYTSTELTANDSFLLQNGNRIIMWNSDDANYEKQTQVFSLARHIQYFEQTTYSTEVQFHDVTTDLHSFLRQFADYSKATKAPRKMIDTNDKVLEEEINASMELVEYTSIIFSGIEKKEITDRPITSDLLHEKNVYLLKDLNRGNIFVIKGSTSAETLFASALQDAEEASYNMSLEDAWTKITIIEGDATSLPLDFLIHFKDVRHELKFQNNINPWF